MLRFTGVLLAAALLSPPAAAQPLAVRAYMIADGLAHNDVNHVFQDSYGYIWISTREGLSRFDGTTFRNYGLESGLAHPIVVAMAEDTGRQLWTLAFESGLARFLEEPANPERRFERIRIAPSTDDHDLVYAAMADRAGAIWAMTAKGVVRIDGHAGRPSFTTVAALAIPGGDGRAYRERSGALWFAVGPTVVRVAPDRSRVDRYHDPSGLTSRAVLGFAEDTAGRLYAVNERELYAFEPGGPDHSKGRWRRLPFDPGEPERLVRSVGGDRSGRLWIGTSHGVVWWRDGRAEEPDLGPELRGRIESLREDRDGHMWVGTFGNGLVRVSGRAFTTYTVREGLASNAVSRVIEDEEGRIFAVTDTGVTEIVGDRAVRVPGSDQPRFRHLTGRAGVDRHGHWWLAQPDGIYFMPRGTRDLTRARVVPAPAATWGQFTPSLSRSTSGRIWIGAEGGLVFEAVADTAGNARLDPIPTGPYQGTWAAGRVADDRDGTLWLSTYGGLTRLRRGGQASPDGLDGLSSTLARAIHADSRGWVWLGFRYHGVAVTREPGAARPTWRSFTQREGLSSNTVWAIAEDHEGRMYFGTGRGLDRLDPASGTIRRFTVSEGLAGAPIQALHVDRHDRVWIATLTGLSRLDAASTLADVEPPAVYITRVQAGGIDRPLPERGARDAPALDLASGSQGVRIDFAGLGFAPGPPPQYEYRLDGLDRDWHPAVDGRSVAFAGLAPGTYRFLVRAVGGDGRPGDQPASLTIHVPTPVWRRPWFLALVAISLVSLGLAIQRVRSARQLALERLRSQMALDLHDDIGAGLSQIAVLSEVGRAGASPSPDPWAEVGDLARTLRAAMSDIVWAVDPRRDTVIDLIRRMRQVALHLLEAAGVHVEFSAPADADVERMPMRPDRRRHLLLAFKEAVHNVAKHAHASRVGVTIAVRQGRFELEVTDDGRGFDVKVDHAGNGLRSLRRRAGALAGTVEISSAPGSGTRVHLSVPLG